ncbi:MAG: tetratricopeptide repeat protein, partial [Cytophagales bacterium]
LNKVYQQIAFYKGVELFNEEKYKEAIILFEKSLQHDLDHETTSICHFWLAEAYSTQKKYDLAILNYQKLINSSFRAPANIATNAFYGLGYAHFNKQEYPKAVNNFKDYLDDAKKFAAKENICDATLRYADCLYSLKKYNEAQITYQKTIENQCPNLDYAYLQKGINLALMNKEQEAQNTLSFIRPESKLYYDAVYNIGLIDFENTKYNASIPLFTKVINDRNSAIYVPLALQKRAVAYNNLKQYQKTAEDYQTILSEYPTNKVAANALIGLQDALSRLGKTDLMDSVIQNYKTINPKDAQIEILEFEKAKLFYFDQNYELAVRNLQKITVDYPTSNFIADAKFYLADGYQKTKKIDLAKEMFDDVIQNHKKSTFYNRSLLKMAEIHFEEKEYSDAIINYNLLTLVNTNQKELSNAWNGLMLSYFEMKKYDSSTIYAKMLLVKGKSSIIIANRASLYMAKSALATDAVNTPDLLINCFNTAEDISGAEAMYLYANDLTKQKSYKLSLEILFDMVNKYVSYEKWIGDGFLLISENYVALGENYQAKATLLSIIEKSKDVELVEKAKLKLNEINEN